MGRKCRMALVTITVWGLTLPAAAETAGMGTNPSDIPDAHGKCNILIMDSECTAFHQALASAPNGAERQRILARYQALIQYRESACGCFRKKPAEIVYYPHR
jgi:hypothetical protein